MDISPYVIKNITQILDNTIHMVEVRILKNNDALNNGFVDATKFYRLYLLSNGDLLLLQSQTRKAYDVKS